MSFIALAIVSLVVLVLILVGPVVGYTISTNDLEIDVLARRLAAEQRIEAATRQTLSAIRDMSRRYNR